MNDAAFSAGMRSSAIRVALAAVLWLGLLVAPAGAGSARATGAGGLRAEVTGEAMQDGRAVYTLRLTDPAGVPVAGARARLEAELPGAVYATSGAGLSGLVDGTFAPAGQPGLYRAEVRYPARGIWQVRVEVEVAGQRLVASLTENVGGVWSEEARGAVLLGFLAAITSLWMGLSVRRRSAAVRVPGKGGSR
ncbi:FixH family protein [Caldinitratiruptor microaerophilus]|uniref:YtkA-like domain-containing protein n=1 Tax=Caldinitratiruptor microaerophilus TaxID=671077 RepID=A0AA35CKS8_9FIRM|nr:FixH family protein [Caldinitratiruptor microaerophilus]BDG61124.1 hypothetical protein caldi_22140 [Caldinitratiruptor microaerophilus]